jgi:hypothetical protein
MSASPVSLKRRPIARSVSQARCPDLPRPFHSEPLRSSRLSDAIACQPLDFI